MLIEFLIGFTAVFLSSLALIGISLMLAWKIVDWFEG
jgi:hypothetical protein